MIEEPPPTTAHVNVPNKAVIAQAVGMFQEVSSLNENQAKTVAYYIIATHGLPALKKIAILIFQGWFGTGKTTLLEAIKMLAYKPQWLDGKVSKAVLRDSLLGETTALIDEADETYEQLLVNRFARQSAKIRFKREAEVGWTNVVQDIFGATAMHRRTPLKDAAIMSRSILIPTKHRDGVKPFDQARFLALAAEFQAAATAIPWSELDGNQGDRIADGWEPLMFAARWFNDDEWLAYADVRIAKSRADMRMGHGEEPTVIVLRTLTAMALSDMAGNLLEEPRERVQLGQLVKRLGDSGLSFNSWQVGQELRDLGFETRTVGGMQYVYVGGLDQLREAAEQLDMEDELLRPRRVISEA